VRFWVGDAVGILVTMPLLLAVAHAERRAAFARLVWRPETLVQGLVLAVTLWLVFWGLGGDPGYHFYALFLPLIWIAVRGGMVAAIGAIAIVQLGVVAGVHSHAAPAFPVLEIQALMAALTLTGLYLGMMVDERARAEESLRQTLRLAAAGDMAGAIAHELNQPLTALANYGQSALMVLGNREYAAAALSEIIHKMLQESQRAAEVVRRLRDFFRAGTTRLQTLQAEELLATVRRLGRQIIGSRPITLEAEAEPGTPALYVDGLQIELVIRNLIANAVEAMEKEAPGEKHIRVRVRRAGESELAVDFLDSGPGLDDDMLERVFEPFVSGKASGMGLGLAISRAIAEAHGGVLEARAAKHGEFHLVLPCLQSI
jgi:two-component system, LuxR family, sensor kinase FixL